MHRSFGFMSIAVLVLICFALIPASSVSAASSSYSGSTVGGTNWVRPFADGTCCSGIGPVTYSTQVVCFTATGAYDVNSIQSAGFDGYLFIYQTSFDPLNQTVNFVAADDDGFGGIGTSDIVGVNLTAGTTYIIVTTGFSLGEEGTFTNTFTGPGLLTSCTGESASNAVQAVRPDDRLNWRFGDQEIVMYNRANAEGNAAIHIYCVLDGKGYLALVIEPSDVPATAPAANTLIASSSDCNVQFWVLAAGSTHVYQVNTGPNATGNLTEILFDDFAGANMEVRNFHN